MIRILPRNHSLPLGKLAFLTPSPLLPLAMLCLLAFWPLLRAGYPTIGDGFIHFYRLVEFDHLLHQGIWFPRWATDLGYGYGYPLFNFYPPLVYYLGAFFHALGLNYAHSLVAVYGLALVSGIVGSYQLARLWGDRAGGVLTAAAYAFSPYLAFNTLARGALPETFALGLLPWTIWAYLRLARKPQNPALVLVATLLYAAICLTHFLSALIAFPLILIIVVAHIKPFTLSPLRSTLISLLLALGLGAYFLLPAVLETNSVQIHQLTGPADLDFRNNFLSLTQLWALPRPFDARLVFIPQNPSLHLITLLGAVGGYMGSLFLKGRESRPYTGLGVIAFSCLGLCYLTLPVARFLWEIFPLAYILQFPWRLVGPASLLLALLVTPLPQVFRAWLQSGRSLIAQVLIFALFPTALYLYSLPWTFAAAAAVPLSPSIADLPAYEATSGQLGTTSTGEFLPLTVQQLPDPTSLQGEYVTHPIIDRVAPLPAGVTLLHQTATPISAEALITTSQPATITFAFFHFPGWQATVDGEPVPITASSPHGLITVPVPGGQHNVMVVFGSTPLRSLSIALSWLSFLILVALLIRVYRQRPARLPQSLPLAPSAFSLQSLRLFGLTCLLLLGLRIWIIDTRPTLFARSRFDGVTVAGVDQVVSVNFAHQLALIGVDWPAENLPADSLLPLTLYWRPQNPLSANYAVSVKVSDEDGHLFGQSDAQHPGRMPTSRWLPDQYAQDAHLIALLPGTPPGHYQVTVTVYQVGGPSLDVLDANQAPVGQAYRLGTVTVIRAEQPPVTLDAETRVEGIAAAISPIGLTIDNTDMMVGNDLHATLFWQVQATPDDDFRLRLELVAPDGELLHVEEIAPARADYPTSQWQIGEIVRAPLTLRVPATIPAGPALWRARLLTPTETPTFILSPITVRVPERSFILPVISQPQTIIWDEKIKWLGYDLRPEGVTLYWQALAVLAKPYIAFVHVLDGQDHILAQIDAPPLGGARPTTSWLPGEVLTDNYVIPLIDAVTIEIGFYDSQTQVRLGTARITP